MIMLENKTLKPWLWQFFLPWWISRVLRWLCLPQFEKPIKNIKKWQWWIFFFTDSKTPNNVAVVMILAARSQTVRKASLANVWAIAWKQEIMFSLQKGIKLQPGVWGRGPRSWQGLWLVLLEGCQWLNCTRCLQEPIPPFGKQLQWLSSALSEL